MSILFDAWPSFCCLVAYQCAAFADAFDSYWARFILSLFRVKTSYGRDNRADGQVEMMLLYKDKD